MYAGDDLIEPDKLPTMGCPYVTAMLSQGRACEMSV